MPGVTIRFQVAGIRHGHVAKEENRLNVGRVGVVVGLDEGLDVGSSLERAAPAVGLVWPGHGRAGHVVAQDGPAVADEVLLQAGQFLRQARGMRCCPLAEPPSRGTPSAALDARVEVALPV